MPTQQLVQCRKGCTDTKGNIREFRGEWGEKVHYQKVHKKRTGTRSGLMEAVVSALRGHPEGIRLNELIEKLHAANVSNRVGKSLGQAISMIAKENNQILRPERGIYVLAPSAASPTSTLLSRPQPVVPGLEDETNSVTAEQQLQEMLQTANQRNRETIMGLCQIIMNNLN